MQIFTVVLCSLLAFSHSVEVSAAGMTVKSSQPTNPALVALNRFAKKFGLDRQKAVHLFVIDFSGSMLWPPIKGAKKPAPKVKKGQPPAPTRWDVLLGALPTLLDAISPGDWVWVIGFHETVLEDPAWVFADWKGSVSRDLLIESMRLQKSFGNWTNVGLALRRAKDILRNAEPRIQNIYLLTDGMHDVPEGNEFFARDSRAWMDLSANWSGLFNDVSRTLLFYMYGLFDVADFRDIKSVIPKVKFLSFSGSGDLNLVFREQVNTALSYQVETHLERERTKGEVKITAINQSLDCSKGEDRFTFQLMSTFSHLTLSGKVNLEVVQKPDDPHFAVQLDTNSFQLDPGKSLILGGKLITKVPSAYFRSWKEEKVVLRLTVSNLEMEPRADFDTAGFASLRPVLNGPQPTEFEILITIQYGRWSNYYKTVLIGAAIFFLLLFFYLFWRTRPRLISAEIEWLKTPDNWTRENNTVLKGRGVVSVGSGPHCHVRIEELPSLFLMIHNRPHGLFGRKITFEVGCRDIMHNEKSIVSGRSYQVISSKIYTYSDLSNGIFEFRIKKQR